LSREKKTNRMKKNGTLCAVLALTAISAASRSALPQSTNAENPAPSSSSATEYQWHLPKGFPKPRVPADNPMSETKVKLGRYLFYDTRLSGNGTQACATCHQQALAFTDGRAQGIGSTDELHSALTPMFGRHPVELGLPIGADDLLDMLRVDPIYGNLVPEAFHGEVDPFTLDNVTKAIAAYERTIISASSPYDRYHSGGEDNAISESAKHGEVLFFSEPLSCFRCHGGFNFSSATTFEGAAGQDRDDEGAFHNTGLYNVSGSTSYPAPNVGIYEFTKQPRDIGKFKVPTLRNIALTAPYMHDGSAKTLDDVLDHYAVGGRMIASGPNAGNGSQNPYKDALIRGFKLSPQDRTDLIAFLNALTDEEVIRDPQFSNPWK
jgi:cytochrome c peroxidase